MRRLRRKHIYEFSDPLKYRAVFSLSSTWGGPAPVALFFAFFVPIRMRTRLEHAVLVPLPVPVFLHCAVGVFFKLVCLFLAVARFFVFPQFFFRPSPVLVSGFQARCFENFFLVFA